MGSLKVKTKKEDLLVEISEIDENQQVTIKTLYDDTTKVWISQHQAEQIIKHLQEQFNLTT